MPMTTFFLEHAPTPIGSLLVVTDADGAVRALDWDDCRTRLDRLLRLHYGAGRLALVDRASASDARRAMDRYFDGEVGAVDAVRVATGGTAFQREVWAALRRTSAGETISYAALAARIGRPAAVRAVGRANGANPVGIVVPCHRVVGANGSLTGYGGGLHRKAWLLAHERRVSASAAVPDTIRVHD